MAGRAGEVRRGPRQAAGLQARWRLAHCRRMRERRSHQRSGHAHLGGGVVLLAGRGPQRLRGGGSAGAAGAAQLHLAVRRHGGGAARLHVAGLGGARGAGLRIAAVLRRRPGQLHMALLRHGGGGQLRLLRLLQAGGHGGAAAALALLALVAQVRRRRAHSAAHLLGQALCQLHLRGRQAAGAGASGGARIAAGLPVVRLRLQRAQLLLQSRQRGGAVAGRLRSAADGGGGGLGRAARPPAGAAGGPPGILVRGGRLAGPGAIAGGCAADGATAAGASQEPVGAVILQCTSRQECGGGPKWGGVGEGEALVRSV